MACSDDLPQDTAVSFIRLFAFPDTNTVPEAASTVPPTQGQDRNEAKAMEYLTTFLTANMFLLTLQQPKPAPAL